MKDAGDITFGRFWLRRRQRQLLKEGVPVKVSSRGFDILVTLIDANGAPVSKDELIRRVWPEVIVEENNLTVQIAALRTALCDERDRLRTVPRHGYSFAADTELAGARFSSDPGLSVEAKAGTVRANIPVPLEPLIGRDYDLRDLLALQSNCRLLTLIGPGGIGKTRLALEVARRLQPVFPDGACVAELATLNDAALVPAAIASAMGVESSIATQATAEVARAVGGRKLLLVLDNCEHVVAEAASVAEALLHGSRGLQILATSREPLGAEGEHLYRVSPLGIPGERVTDANEIMRHGAIQLFVARARAAGVDLSADETQLSAIAAIGRRLDGIPLAIELAAARVTTLGVGELLSRLDDCFAVLSGGRRTALPRQQTMRATLDWSYSLLTEPERMLLCRLGVFVGAFSLEAASAVVASPELSPAAIIDGVVSLAGKSLIAANVDSAPIRYRLLDTTRAYALEKLQESGELEAVARRHAEYYRDVFERSETEWQARPTAEWLADYGPKIDNLRAALDWAFSSDGDAEIAVALSAAAVPVWMQLSLTEECRSRVTQAMHLVEQRGNGDVRQRMKLHAALGASLLYMRGDVPELEVHWTRALEIADRLQDQDYKLRSLWGLWSFHMPGGQHEVALRLAQRFGELAASRVRTTDRLIGELMMGASQHYLGDQDVARRHVERALAEDSPTDRWSDIPRFQVHHRVMARVFLARILWLQGFPNQASRVAECNFADACTTNHAVSLCYALAVAACPIALLVGDLESAGRFADLLVETSTRNTLMRWQAFGCSFRGLVAMRRGNPEVGLPLLRAALRELGDAGSGLLWLIRLLMAEVLCDAGAIAEGLRAVEDAMEPCEHAGERWRIAELLRVKGELMLLQAEEGAAAVAENHFRRALCWANRQGSLSWELRAATSLARLLKDQARTAEAATILQAVFERFTEGFETADVRSAKSLLDSLQ